MKKVFLLFLFQSNLVSAMIYQEWQRSHVFFENLPANLEKQYNFEKPINTATYKNKNIYFSRQIIANRLLLNSFYKKTLDPIGVVETQTYIVKSSQPMLEAAKEQVLSLSSAEAILKKYSRDFSKVEILSIESLYINDADNKFQKSNLVSFFDRFGQAFNAFINSENEIYKLVRTGAQFSNFNTKVYTYGPKLSPLTDQQLMGSVINPKITNTNVAVGSESNQKIIELNETMDFDLKDDRFDQIQVFYYLNKALEWMAHELQITLKQPIEAVVHMGYPDKTNSAFYFQNRIRLGKGDDVFYSNIAHDASIVYHETFHALIDSVSRLPFEGEGGSINEAFADFFTALMLKRPYLAESSFLKDKYKRSLKTFKKLSDKSGGLYGDSLIVSGMLWEVYEKLGHDKSKLIAIETLTKLNPYSKFVDFNKKFIIVCQQELNIEDYSLVVGILKNRGFEYE